MLCSIMYKNSFSHAIHHNIELFNFSVRSFNIHEEESIVAAAAAAAICSGVLETTSEFEENDRTIRSKRRWLQSVSVSNHWITAKD